MRLIDILNEGKKKPVSKKKKVEKKPVKKERKNKEEVGREPGDWIGADHSEKEEQVAKSRPITFKKDKAPKIEAP